MEKENPQNIESTHINLRTQIKRFVRRTMCLSKTAHLYDLVIGLCSIDMHSGGPLIWNQHPRDIFERSMQP